MTSSNPGQNKKPSPPAAGSRPSLRIDDALAADLADLMSTGPNFTDAVRQAVGQLAAMYRTAWEHGIVSPGTAPVLAAYQFAPPAPLPPASSGYDTTSDTRPPRPIGQRLPSAPPGPHVRLPQAKPCLTRRTPAAPPGRRP
ncbi:hypothetical protein [Streptomyces sp. 8L]|uniref:hypothetical protein n=1 Tax=Streptomyces sp. 8L TaxID=2877242 RepID=UPI001CD8156A|nr:hypothetical protein [Streptomyces sp. 8L]MCA1221311.1 hypothetical protein [Streptomyces sp. 8L]